MTDFTREQQHRITAYLNSSRVKLLSILIDPPCLYPRRSDRGQAPGEVNPRTTKLAKRTRSGAGPALIEDPDMRTREMVRTTTTTAAPSDKGMINQRDTSHC